ncbi:MAG: alpha/beta hydrolase [Burkholderiales bacterium]|nr:alpha/beta hydrolase [Burkholderiales bacterium]
MARRSYVLVHGAWHGGWCWAAVEARLAACGESAYALTLSGLAHRQDRRPREIDADRHVLDVAQFVETLDLERVVLVLHSYSGVLGPALLGRLRGRVVGLRLIEAALAAPGQALLDAVPPAAAQRYRETAYDRGDGLLIPPPDPRQFHIADPALAAAIGARLTPQPWRTFAEPVSLPGAALRDHGGAYLIATDRDPQPYLDCADQLALAGWRVDRVPGGHELMQTNPAAVVDFLRHA